MRNKNIFVSIRKNHDVMDLVINRLEQIPKIDLTIHRPIKNIINIESIIDKLRNSDYLILKASNKISIDILQFAQMYKIPSLHSLNAVVTCLSKIALDGRLRQIIEKYNNRLRDFILPIPESWTGVIKQNSLEEFKEWAKPNLPLVIKSHDQHDKNIRFSFRVRNLDEIDDFYNRFKTKLDYAVYIQKEINCDDIDRKVYVIGDKTFGIQRESPIVVSKRENLDYINPDSIKKEQFDVPEKAKMIAKILSKELDLKLFGFDLIKSADQEKYYLIDVNDFPGYRGIPNVHEIIVDFLKNLLKF
ncbi:MAG: hypothetical protein GF383_01465 [Candidatus Lokiarchaeota archaeon]|nr:hypothetical protein [Candidatus Lokiarchaeota archaeon]MBD3337932.1 hypothetical protein [Candidatus Lokiarchaeota archaeon]